jgi:hypothetical protein
MALAYARHGILYPGHLMWFVLFIYKENNLILNCEAKKTSLKHHKIDIPFLSFMI